MYELPDLLECGHGPRLEPAEPVQLVRPDHVPGGDIPLPVAESPGKLRFDELAVLQVEHRFGGDTLADVAQRQQVPARGDVRTRDELDPNARTVCAQ